MKVLLDENVPHDLRPLLAPQHDAYTVAYMGWRTIENGELLTLARDTGFDVLVTTDSKMEHEQNTASLPIAVVVLRGQSNAMEHLKPYLPALLETLRVLKPRTLVTIGN